MYIYNVTINIEDDVHTQWLDWMQNKHIPDMLGTGKFLKAKLCKVLVDEELGGTTYSIQYTTKDKETLERYYKEDADRLRADGLERFEGKFVAFRTELQVIDEQKQSISSATEYLFTYGTLQDQEVQRMVFSRQLEGISDLLKGHKISVEQVAGLYPSIVPTDNPSDEVEGRVYAISGADLLRADDYEGKAYGRKEVVLESGIVAWAYFGNMNGT